VNALQVSSHTAFPNVMRLSHETSVSDQVTLIDGSPSPYPSSYRSVSTFYIFECLNSLMVVHLHTLEVAGRKLHFKYFDVAI